jgi:hypothetical protein
VPVAAMIAYAATHNNNGTMAPSVLRGANVGTQLSGDRRLDLPCGVYYLDYVNVNGNVTLAAHGNTALFISGAIVTAHDLDIFVDPGASFDLFVGTDIQPQNTYLGSPAYPSQLRIYVGASCQTGAVPCVDNGSCCSGKCTNGTCAASGGTPMVFQASNSEQFNAEFYGPNGLFVNSAATEVYGSLVVGGFQSSASVKVHYDKGVAIESNSCGSSSGQSCSSCLDCGNQACNSGGTCGSCSSDSDCCAPLRCVNGTCEFTSF